MRVKDSAGREYGPDPSGRYRYRALHDGTYWTQWVANDLDGFPTEDPLRLSGCPVIAAKPVPIESLIPPGQPPENPSPVRRAERSPAGGGTTAPPAKPVQRNGWHILAGVVVALTLADLLLSRYTGVGYVSDNSFRVHRYATDCGNGWLVLTMSEPGCVKLKGQVWLRLLVGVGLAFAAWSYGVKVAARRATSE